MNANTIILNEDDAPPARVESPIEAARITSPAGDARIEALAGGPPPAKPLAAAPGEGWPCA